MTEAGSGRVTFYMTKPSATPMMAGLGFSFPDLITFARHAVNLLQKVGDEAVLVLEQGFKFWSAISGRDLSGIIAAFSAGKENVEAIIEAIHEEFGV